METRYLELATPIEFDGIRTQIAQELEIPKTAVKKIIKDLRDRQHIPSWWEAQSYKGNEEELAKIMALYEPYLPLPNVGVHKQIAGALSLKPGDVYQAIKKIRADMGLPQYNDPELHPELKAEKPTAEAKGEAQTETEKQSEVEAASAPTNSPDGKDTVETIPTAPVPTDSLNGTDTGDVVNVVKEEVKPEEAKAEPVTIEATENETSTKTEA